METKKYLQMNENPKRKISNLAYSNYLVSSVSSVIQLINYMIQFTSNRSAYNTNTTM